MNQNQLQHRAAQAVASLEAARTPFEKAHATREAIDVKAALEKHQADDAALAAIRKSQARGQPIAKLWR
jgi:hypothetical protein